MLPRFNALAKLVSKRQIHLSKSIISSSLAGLRVSINPYIGANAGGSEARKQRFHSNRIVFGLIPAYGAKGLEPSEPLDLLLKGETLKNAIAESLKYFSLTLTPRQLCDIEMILNGAFTPLQGFMNQKDYDNVVERSRLSNGLLFPIPITLDVTHQQASDIKKASADNNKITLRDVEGNALAILDIEDFYVPDKKKEADLVFTGDPEHPSVDYLNRKSGDVYIGGRLRGLQLPPHYDHADLRLTPAQTRALLPSDRPVVAFQTRNPLHRAHFELTRAATKSVAEQGKEGFLLLHPVVGMTKMGDIDYQTRVKCYRAIMPRYDPKNAKLSVIPLAMRMAGPREAILHAIIRQNYGASHFIIGRDHAGPGSNSKKVDFYSPYAARDAALAVQNELKIKLLPFEQLVYVNDGKSEEGTYVPVNAVPEGLKAFSLSGTEVRRRLSTGEDIPEWFSFNDVVKILRARHPPKHKQGLCIFFTGLSGSGKSTVAMALRERFMQLNDRPIVLLDGDEVRSMISSELGFSAEHRNLNINRIGWIASQIALCGGLAIAAPIAPYHKSRVDARRMVSANGAFVQVYMASNVDVCSQRDRKGLYAKAKLGLIKHMTGVDDPYEQPLDSEIVIDPNTSVEKSVDQIIQYLIQNQFIKLQAD